MRRLAPPMLALFLLAAPGFARAEPSEAERRTIAEALFADAQALEKQGDYGQACPKYAEVTRLLPGKVGALQALAECYEGAGKIASAKTSYEAAERAATAANDARAAALHAKAQELAPRVPLLTIEVPAALRAVGGLVITRDDLDVGAAQWGVAIPIDPGRHVMSAAAPGRTAWRSTVEIVAGAGPTTITIPALAEASPASPVRPESARSPVASSAPLWPWIVGGAGLAFLGVAAGFGVDGLAAKNRIAEQCGENYATVPCQTRPEIYKPEDDTARKNRGLAMFIGFGSAGAIAIGAAIVGLSTSRSEATRAAARVQVIPSVGTDGGGLWVRGGF